MVLLDISDGAAKGGTMDLEIFALPNVEISKGIRCCYWNGSEYCTVCACACFNESRTSGEIQRLWHIDHLFKKMLSFHSFLLFFIFSGQSWEGKVQQSLHRFYFRLFSFCL